MPNPTPTAQKLRPIIFGRLCLLERISVGGMAEVYRAKPFNAPEFDRLLAVKRILPNLAEDDEFIQMFADEAKIAIRLNHHNIAQIYELGKRGNSHYIVMEYIAGHDLLAIRNRYRRLKRTMAPKQVAFIIQSVANALGHAHDQRDDEGEPLGIVHRDVSPQNVLVSYSGEVKLIDFGIAKVAKRTTETQVGVLKGKFSYMSPEQVAGQLVDHRADLFSLGTITYELLTGRRLFKGESDFHTLERVRQARVEPPSTFNDAVPWQLDNLTLKALARDPDKRYQHASEIADDLQAYLDSLDEVVDRQHLSDWMVAAFSRELGAEHRRREFYKKFVTPEDVQEHNEELIAELRRSLNAPAVDEGEPELDDNEITQVSASAYEELEDELVESELEKGKVEEVLAGYEMGALAKLLSERSDRVLASIDLPEAREREEPPEELFEPHRRRSRRGILMVPLFLALVALAVFIGVRELRDSTEEPQELFGQITIDVVPSEDLQIFFDGRLVATEAPTTLADIEAGRHGLEIRHAQHQTHQEELVVESGQAVSVRVVLLPLSQGEGRLSLTVEPADAEVWLDGTALVGSGHEREVRVAGRHVHLVEVRRPGYYVEEEELSLEPGEHRALAIALRRVQGTLVLRSEPAGIAFLDGTERGSTAGGLVVEELDPTIVHDLVIEPSEVGFRRYESEVIFDSAHELNLFATLRRIGDDRQHEQVAFGYLSVVTGQQWYHVLVDGRDTGQTTPISADAPLALRVGAREVSLVRGDVVHTGRVVIESNQISSVDCQSQQWPCDQEE